MKTCVVIGNRCSGIEGLNDFGGLQIVTVFAVENSRLSEAVLPPSCDRVIFSSKESRSVIEKIAQLSFDVLLSAGCPVILPVSKIKKTDQLFINIHPSLLPLGRGTHPINEVLLAGRKHFGATLHYMDDGVDTGRIIHQEREPVTEDLDLGLLYHLAFSLERKVVANGFQKLAGSAYLLEGQAQEGESSYYTRKSDDHKIDLSVIGVAELLRRVKAFGIHGQGVEFVTSGQRITAYAAEAITNALLASEFARAQPGELLLRYDGKLIVKTQDGYARISDYKSDVVSD
jgi:methionyl-tRNA formyltransferase